MNMDENGVNYGFENDIDGFTVYTGRDSVPITLPPVPLGRNTTVATSQVSTKSWSSSCGNDGPRGDIELQTFGQREHLKNFDFRNSQFEQRQHHDMAMDTTGSHSWSNEISEFDLDTSKGKGSLCLTFLKLFTIIAIVWDTITDWMIVLKFDDQTCYTKNIIDKSLLTNMKMCDGDREKMRQVFSIVTMFGSIIGLLQIINIILDILYNWGLVSFRLIHAQYDLYISLYFEEIPQAIILLIFNQHCVCDLQGRALSLVAITSGFASCILRYGTSFRTIRGDRGCCNTWWRCCCCRQHQYLFHCGLQDCCCRCDIPCPLLCCTLRCDSCRWTTNTWCPGWMQMFSCFCSCCSEDKTMFGVRIMNNLGIICLFSGLLAMGILWGIVP